MKIILSAQTIWRLLMDVSCDRILKADVCLVKLYLRTMDIQLFGHIH